MVSHAGRAVYFRPGGHSLQLNPTPDRAAAVTIDDDEMAFELEWLAGHTFAHCVFKRPWSAALRRRSVPKLEAQFALHGGPLFATSPEPHAGDYVKHGKFLTQLCGFRYLQMIPTPGGREQPVYVWTPPCPSP